MLLQNLLQGMGVKRFGKSPFPEKLTWGSDWALPKFIMDQEKLYFRLHHYVGVKVAWLADMNNALAPEHYRDALP